MKLSTKIVKSFTDSLYQWREAHPRNLPWKEDNSPYLTWLSEIMLQQTQVVQGTSYFLAFKKAYPTIEDLAKAPEEEILKLWQGLGYYSRARNLHFTAKHIAFDLNGQFPNTFESLKALKGVGDYTAAAIASFAYNLPHAVVDGNVFRVLSRYFDLSDPIDSSAGKKLFAALADQLLDKKEPGYFNQAIMDFGATHCKPKNPLCVSCSLNKSCAALREETISLRPVKTKKIKKKDRFFHYFIISNDQKCILSKRMKKDIWQHLFEYPLLETPTKEIISLTFPIKFGNVVVSKSVFEKATSFGPFVQQLSHQKITAIFYQIHLSDQNTTLPRHFQYANIKDLHSFAVPRIISKFHEEWQQKLF